MSEVVLKIENVSKQYRLGLVGTGTLSHDLKRWWYLIRGKEDPFLKVGEVNERKIKGREYVKALNDINLEIKKGEVVGVIGKNGAGKSTLLKLLSEVTTPTTGSIKMKGRIAALLEVGTGFHPELTGRENIYLNGAILGMTKKEINSKIEEIIDFSGVAKYVDTPVKRYSSGMKVRLGFAVAAHLEPDILIVDEVLAVGDAEFQSKCIGKMQDVAGEGRTVLFVSHNMASIRNLCQRAIVLKNGIINFDGSVEDGIEHYLTTQSNSALKDIALRTDRDGSGNLKFTEVNLKNSKNINCFEIISGESLILEAKFSTTKEIDGKDVILGITFWDKYETRVLGFASDEMGVRFSKLENGRFILKIPNFNLRGGIYYVKLTAAKGGTGTENMLDNIRKAITINVLPGDFWSSGSVNRKGSMALLEGTMTND